MHVCFFFKISLLIYYIKNVVIEFLIRYELRQNIFAILSRRDPLLLPLLLGEHLFDPFELRRFLDVPGHGLCHSLITQ